MDEFEQEEYGKKWMRRSSKKWWGKADRGGTKRRNG